MAYVVPQVLVHQEFRIIPAELADALRAHISGGHAQLLRYSDDDEKSLGFLGAYQPNADTGYLWPSREAGAVVDDSYVRLFVDDALLAYFEDLIGQDGTIVPVAGSTNVIHASAAIFKTGNGSDRSDAFRDRDVQLGDAVWVRGVVGGESVSMWSYVRGFGAKVVAATVGDATLDSDNQASQSASITGSQTAGVENCLELTTDASNYDGLTDGHVNDTYTVKVIDGSTDGDLTTASLQITTTSGADDVAAVSPDAVGGLKTVGGRGLQLGFSISGAGSSCSADDPDTANDLVAGQTWQITVAAEHEQATATAGGTYAGDSDTTYIVEVSRGGSLDTNDPTEQPQVTVTTTHGIDIGTPTNVTGDDIDVPVGTKGVTIAFQGSSGSGASLSAGGAVGGLRKGDRFYITVTAEGAGAYQRLELGHDLGELADATDLDLKLYIKKNIEVSRNRDGFAPLVNFETSDTEITVQSGLLAYDPDFTDAGVPVALDVVGGELYVEYRAWLPDLVNTVGSITDVGELDGAISGPLHPDNPLKWGVYYALLNSNGTAVKYTAVADPDDDDEWLNVLEQLVGRDDVYNLVPLTHSRTILNAYAGHVDSQSSAESGRWRGLFVSLTSDAARAVVNAATNGDDEVLATVADDPGTSGTQYTLVTADDADFITNDAAPGDILRTQYTSDGFGAVAYSEYVIDEVISENTVRLVSGPTQAISVAAKMEVWHNNTKNEIATQVGQDAGSYGSRRVVAVWPDTASSGDYVMDGYHVAAALAGLRSGVVPHQGLTNVELAGFDSVPRTTEFFNSAQLNILAESGVWIVTQDDNGNIQTRHAVTTGDSNDVNSREEMIRVNVDAMSYVFLRRLAPYIGRANVAPGTISMLRAQIDSIIDYLKTNGFVPSLGAQLIDGEILQLRQHVLLPDRITAVLQLTIPYPLNNVEVHLVV